MMTLTRSLFAGAALCVAGPVAAQDSLNFDNFSAGLRVVASSSIYAGGQATAVPIPNLGFSADAVSVGVEGIRFRLYSDDLHRFDAMLRPRFAPYEADDSPQLVGMDRDFTADVGFRYAYTTPSDTQFSILALTEVTGEHNGQEVELRLSQGFGNAGLPIAVYGGVVWRSDDLSGYLYGVRPSEAIVGRAAYDPGDTLSPFIGISTLVPVTDRLSLTAALRAEFLASEIQDSPIVSEDVGVSGTLGFLWRF